MSHKIFRDPLYNYIAIDRSKDQWLLDLLDTPEVQRLRRIHQLGVSYLTYPGASHSRLSHSLGVLHLMQQAINHLSTLDKSAAISDARTHLLAAALLHDVGHGPFSHVFESCLGTKHEEWSCNIIQCPDTGINKVLRDYDGSLPNLVSALIEKDNFSRPTWQKNLLSSQLDIDRLDYIRRDSMFTGAGYGHFDWYRILNTFTRWGTSNQGMDLVWSDKAKFAIEEYIFSRFYMYKNVYFHKTTRGYEKLLDAMWSHAKELFKKGDRIELLKPIKAFWSSSNPSVLQYLGIEEQTVMYQIQIWKNCKNESLSDMARRFLDRDGLVMIPAPNFKGAKYKIRDNRQEWERKLRTIIRKKGIPGYKLLPLKDDLKINIYSPYYPEKEDELSPINAIRILKSDSNKPEEISDLLSRLKTVTKRPDEETFYYIPKEIRAEATKLKSEWKEK